MPRLHNHHRQGHTIHRVDTPGGTDWVARIGKKIKPQPNGCWLFTGKLNAGGYGVAFNSDVEELAHRFVYRTLVGEIPDGIVLHHECHTPACVNPEHLTPMTRGDHTAHHHALRVAS